MKNQYRDKTLRVVVTGAGEGVGHACAAAFARRGAELVLTDSDGVALTRAGDRLSAHARFCDVASEASVAIFAADLGQAFDSIDVLINAAGNGYVRSLGMMRMSNALLPLLRRGRGNRLIVNIAPSNGVGGRHGMFPHAGSQHGFQQLSDALALKTKGSGIAVMVVPPTLRPLPVAGEAELGWDANSIAARVVDLVRGQRPEWVPVAPPSRRRA